MKSDKSNVFIPASAIAEHGSLSLKLLKDTMLAVQVNPFGRRFTPEGTK